MLVIRRKGLKYTERDFDFFFFFAIQHKRKLIFGKVMKSYKCDTTPRSRGTQSKNTLRGIYFLQVDDSIIKEEYSNLLFHDFVIKAIYFRLDF